MIDALYLLKSGLHMRNSSSIYRNIGILHMNPTSTGLTESCSCYNKEINAHACL